MTKVTALRHTPQQWEQSRCCQGSELASLKQGVPVILPYRDLLLAPLWLGQSDARAWWSFGHHNDGEVAL